VSDRVHGELAAPASGPASGRRTIGALWLDAVAEGHTRPAYLVQQGTAWKSISWAEAGKQVEELAGGFLAAGVSKGDAFGIIGSARLEWVLFDYALALVGAITVPIYATSSPQDCAYALAHADATGVLVEDEALLDSLEKLREPVRRMETVLTFDGLDDLAARGRDYLASHPAAVAQAVRAVDEDDLYTYMFTSGTTGRQRACMIRHRNAYEMAAVIAAIEDFAEPDDVVLLYLPLAHSFGRLVHLLGTLVGFTIAFCPDPYAVRDALPEVRPTILPSVPRLFEKVHAAALSAFAEQRGPRRALVNWALKVGRRAGELRSAGKPLPPGLALQHRLADRLVYSKFKSRLGGRLRYAVSGGAPLSTEVAEFFHALDILVLEGYGMTECTAAAAVNRPGRYRFGTVGLPLPRFQVRTAPDGELLVRSCTLFAGYYKDAEATRAVVDDEGWLHTGDVGEIDADGFVRVTDRKKDILITAGGKKVAPQSLENELKASRFISQALVVGDLRPYVVALMTLDSTEIEPWAAARGIEEDAAALARNPKVNALVQELVDGVNRERSRYEQVKRFVILPRDFSADEGEVTPTLKLKRRVCLEHFADEIERLYADLSSASSSSWGEG
jgi:long-chain acyl-CoA synthetase